MGADGRRARVGRCGVLYYWFEAGAPVSIDGCRTVCSGELPVMVWPLGCKHLAKLDGFLAAALRWMAWGLCCSSRISAFTWFEPGAQRSEPGTRAHSGGSRGPDRAAVLVREEGSVLLTLVVGVWLAFVGHRSKRAAATTDGKRPRYHSLCVPRQASPGAVA